MTHHPSIAELARIENLVVQIEFLDGRLSDLTLRLLEKENLAQIEWEILRTEMKRRKLMVELRSLASTLTYVPSYAASVLQ
ncbi:GfV-C19-ORF1 [Ichnoviriform fumiferanae]|uniref:GfV-B54-ORF1 n=1 Tax=Ichnoviriform fumiferanae TaxID=419435 RepID=A2PZV1_9VIRU|nr:GfV-C19-ORF1 [Ichnoviriform fumiferanae]YP_001029440.1 GfV-B54-ORF1 [Ichnoviriform fumiferanae]BAF45523.1 GfV-B54-ORF1 [Ichnoviriform fumiferanae]BAF45558.1 GfV-C19-ORF1 [Ichnoviriform fumiferanae]